MSVTDVIKKSVLAGFTESDLSTISILVCLGMAIVMGLFIYFLYRTTTRSGFYNRGFNKSLATLPVITAGIMLAMQSNLVISLGMVGALSIVRFRNAVKDPADLTYLFWSISMGIVIGAGLYELAILLSLCVAALVVMLDMLPAFRAPCILVISAEPGTAEGNLLSNIKEHTARAKVRSRNISKKGTEWIIELQVKNEEALSQSVMNTDGVISMNLLTHDGEVRF